MKGNSGRTRILLKSRRIGLFVSIPSILLLLAWRRSSSSAPKRTNKLFPADSQFATVEMTKAFSLESIQHANAHKNSFREAPTGQILSSIGIGTYLGDKDDSTDRLVADAIVRSVNAGVNVIDSASNYRSGRGEVSVGLALRRLFADVDDGVRRRRFQRSELFISTKAGFVSTPELKDLCKKKGATKNDFGAGGKHCIAPACLEASLDISLQRMGIETVDLFYLHNVAEKRASEMSAEDMMDNILRAFTFLETERSSNRIRYYGLATFSKSFRTPPDSSGALGIYDLVKLARKAAGCPPGSSECNHGMRFVQLPVSPHDMSESYSKPWQSNPAGQLETLAKATVTAGVGIFSSKSLGLPHSWASCLDLSILPSSSSHKSQVLDVTRSSPGLLSALVGHKTPEHVEENLKVMSHPTLPLTEFNLVVKKC